MEMGADGLDAEDDEEEKGCERWSFKEEEARANNGLVKAMGVWIFVPLLCLRARSCCCWCCKGDSIVLEARMLVIIQRKKGLDEARGAKRVQREVE